MLKKQDMSKRDQIGFYSLDDLVPQENLLRVKKYDYVYDEYFDCYICPNMKTLNYTTTIRTLFFLPISVF